MAYGQEAQVWKYVQTIDSLSMIFAISCYNEKIMGIRISETLELNFNLSL